MSQYDYLVVGARFAGAVFANAAKRAGKSVLVIDRRDHIAGNIYTEDVGGIAGPPLRRAHLPYLLTRNVWGSVRQPLRHVQQLTSTRRWQNTKTACTTCLSI